MFYILKIIILNYVNEVSNLFKYGIGLITLLIEMCSNCSNIKDVIVLISTITIFIILPGIAVISFCCIFVKRLIIKCVHKMLKKIKLPNLMINLISLTIVFGIIFIIPFFTSLSWTIERFKLEKANEILFKLYDENAEKSDYWTIDIYNKIDNDSCIHFDKDCTRMTFYRRNKEQKYEKKEIIINKQDSKMLKKILYNPKYDYIFISNDIILYQKGEYAYQYNRKNVLDEDCGRHIDYDRRWRYVFNYP